MFRRDLWRYCDFWDDLLNLRQGQWTNTLGNLHASIRRTFATKDSLMSEVMMDDFPTPSAVYQH